MRKDFQHWKSAPEKGKMGGGGIQDVYDRDEMLLTSTKKVTSQWKEHWATTEPAYPNLAPINGELEENNFKVEIGGVWGDGVTAEDCPISVQRKSCLWGLASTLDCSLVRVGLPQLHLVTYPVVKFTDYSCIHPGWMAGWMDEGMDGLKILLNQMEVVTFFGSKHSLCIYYMKSWW